ncbi:hypothetical protein RND71_036619 [Anisodus tanguticus]|uniref:Thymidine kinase n=1 Tax=Anisodus tanguticus TaxID=243964 RepID=A0AAE1V0H0_9SOLA|nr:hypothetical protein RND71_036619 [Anisodus tanguticus]
MYASQKLQIFIVLDITKSNLIFINHIKMGMLYAHETPRGLECGDDQVKQRYKVDVIGIDEAQFFYDLYDFCCNAADIDGKTVVVAGLDGDYLRYFLTFEH